VESACQRGGESGSRQFCLELVYEKFRVTDSFDITASKDHHPNRTSMDRTGREFVYAGTELDAMAAAPNYYRAIYDWLRPYLGRTTLEVGAGVGTFSQLLADDPTIHTLTLLEPAKNNFPVLANRFAADDHVNTFQGFLEDFDSEVRFEAIVLINVLEHVANDRAFLEAALRRLAPGARILLFVPALPFLFGSLDRAFDHHRRYTRRSLRLRLKEAGFRVHRLNYVNLPGIVSWFLMGRVLHKRSLGVKDVALYDRLVIPWAMKLERLIPPPLGQSLLAVGERTA
jgi:SAM-dependent methyltransferase